MSIVVIIMAPLAKTSEIKSNINVLPVNIVYSPFPIKNFHGLFAKALVFLFRGY